MRQLVSKIKYTQSYTEILEYIQFTFPEKFTLMEGNKSTFQFVS
ncbi:hypothetical protein BXY75_1972 [Ulvibacter antarcticus]|uniref:Uncharacterized protein n=1 Tax=Ulvibacter antarcticus TaxID=442714 RepID=A0A3L9YHC8_9FLAO|nr:hypothetical protein BXY75_1972 [Ulvibacter antarcticus]